MPREIRAARSRSSSDSGNGANCAGTWGNRLSAVTCRSGVSGLSREEWVSPSRASSSAPSCLDLVTRWDLSAMAAMVPARQGGDQEVKVLGRLPGAGCWGRGRGAVWLAAVPASPHRLPRTLGLWSGMALVVGITIGSGIFRTPAGIARLVPSARLVLCLWVTGGVITLAGALSLSELAAALPESGGFYAYLRECWGRQTAFLFGWA